MTDLHEALVPLANQWIDEVCAVLLAAYPRPAAPARLHFHHVNGDRADANAGAPSVLVAYGQRAAERLAKSSIQGHVVSLERQAA